MEGEEEEIILECGALVGKAGLKRVSSEMVWIANEQEERREGRREGGQAGRRHIIKQG